jgi:N-acetylmuramoyl-L-alanine amidase
VISRPSPNFDERPEAVPIDMLVLHYTGMPDRDQALSRLTDPTAQVSAHYLIDEDGCVFILVEEAKRAWHAGRSAWRGQSNINGRSIGIELVNPGHEFGYRPFPPAQMESLADLATGILARHPIPARNVVGHADIAPQRKEDPGELFDWRWLARQGIGLWPTATQPATDTTGWQNLMRAWGYDLPPAGQDAEAERAALIAFQRHFRPARLSGLPDEETVGLLRALLAMV